MSASRDVFARAPVGIGSVVSITGRPKRHIVVARRAGGAARVGCSPRWYGALTVRAVDVALSCLDCLEEGLGGDGYHSHPRTPSSCRAYEEAYELGCPCGGYDEVPEGPEGVDDA